MKWSSLFLPIAFLASGISAAKKSASTGDKFADYHKTLKSSSSPIKLNDAEFRKITTPPRDYSVAVLLTAMDQRYGCQLCREFQPEWELLTKSWTKGDKKGVSRLLYSTLDFQEGRETFMAMGLQTAPVLFLYRPTTGPHADGAVEPLRFDFSSGTQTAERVQEWLAKNLPDRPHPSVRRPFNWVGWGIRIISTVTIGTAGFVFWPYIAVLLWNKKIWLAICMVIVLTMTSGFMYNQIRGVPYVNGDGKGGIVYFAPGFQSQYGLETQLVAAMYGALALTIVFLVDRVPRIKGAQAQQMAVIVAVGACLVLYSFLVSVFRVKNGGYPFFLPPFV